MRHLWIVAMVGCATTPHVATPLDDSGRHFELHLPAHPPVGRYPLVVALHGALGSGAHLERTIGLDAIADREGFAVVYPDGIGSRWNDGRPDDRDPDDGTTVKAIAFAGCADAASVEILVIDGGGHTWPGGTGELEAINGVRSRELSASERIWQFFASHRRS